MLVLVFLGLGLVSGPCLDFRGIRPTDVKNNPRTQLPKPRSPKEEAELLTRATLTENEFKIYIENIKQGESLMPGEKGGSFVKLTKVVRLL